MDRLFEKVEMTDDWNARGAGWGVPESSSLPEEDSDSKEKKAEQKSRRVVNGEHCHDSLRAEPRVK